MRSGNGETVGYPLLSRYRGELMGLAMLWVMLFHAYNASFGLPVLNGLKAFGYLGVDIFIFLSGMGLQVSLSKGRKLGEYFRRRAFRILPAYWLVVGLYGLWLRLRGQIRMMTVLWSMSTLHYWFHIPDTFNWYISALIAFYFIAPFYARLLRVRSKWLLTLAISILSYGFYRMAIVLGVSYMSDFLFRIPAFALGSLWGNRLAEGCPMGKRDAIGWSALAAVGIILIALTRCKVIYLSACYLFAAVLVPCCLLAAILLRLLPWDGPRRLLRLLGECSLEIYLWNVVFTREYPILREVFGFVRSQWLYYGGACVMNLLLGIGLHKLISLLTARLERLGERTET